MQLFYTPDIIQTQTLSQLESHHAVKVLRLNEGDVIQVVDGNGGFYNAVIVSANAKACRIELKAPIQDQQIRPYRLHMAVAPTKNIDRFEWFLEKATEIGVDEITPLLCEHSERKIVKPDRVERILVSAMKQSLKSYLPKQNDMMPFQEFISQARPSENLMIAHCYETERDTIKTLIPARGNTITILIGPEGDFSPEEVEQSLKCGFSPLSLGNSRLRTETAAVVACHSVYEFYL
ncbi:16S rRNA (uracil(1498)-N(3))-methyltransferase [Saccharicrinis sp. FJH54]|uniref:16S rRNA (uracil(1498)-N(3))-methyltransferase n=1 Tax=Saccharicrinis sp. FJH54 TaxID=3344665 RepID=UPI0035D49760